MATKSEQFQKIWHLYEKEHEHLPASAREAIEWGVEQNLITLPEIDPFDVLADQMARAMRGEYRKDKFGRKYRVNHAVRVMRRGVQHTIWSMIGFAKREHMEKSFFQRREQIVGDCLQLKTDVDVYNDQNKSTEPIQMILDFSDDVAERQIMQSKKNKKAA